MILNIIFFSSKEKIRLLWKMLFRNVERVWPSQGENKAWNQIGSNLTLSTPSKDSKNWTPSKIWTPSFSSSPRPSLNFLSRPFTQLCFFCRFEKVCTWAAIRLVFPMVELSMEVIEGLREPLIGLRCWISRCTLDTKCSKASKLRHKLTKRQFQGKVTF